MAALLDVNALISLSDEWLFKAELIVGARQVTDAYLLGRAARKRGKLVSFDSPCLGRRFGVGRRG